VRIAHTRLSCLAVFRYESSALSARARHPFSEQESAKSAGAGSVGIPRVKGSATVSRHPASVLRALLAALSAAALAGPAYAARPVGIALIVAGSLFAGALALRPIKKGKAVISALS
jgi:hypothetical protein